MVGRSLYLTDGAHDLQVRSPELTPLRPGDVVEVLGFVAAERSPGFLVDAVYRRIGATRPPGPARVDVARLAGGDHHNALVTVEATLLRHAVDADEHELVLQAGGTTFEASLPLSAGGARLDTFVDGSLLEVTGITAIRTRNGEPLSFAVRLRGVDDVRVLQHPSWWTPQRTLYLLVAVLIGFVSTSGWVVALRRRLPAMERARLESEERYRQLFEQAPAAHFVTRPDGTLIACNDAFAVMLGFASADTAIGANCESLYVDATDRQRWLDLLQDGGRRDNGEVMLRGADGRLVYAMETAVARFDPQGDISEIQGFLIDRTEQKCAEAMLRERDAQFQQSQKLEAIGRLAGGVAHDFNNLLTAITGYSDLVRVACTDRPDLVEYIGEVQKAAKSATELTRQLLAFSRKQTLETTVLDLNVVVSELDKMLRRLLGEDIELVSRVSQAPLNVKADRAQLDQVLVNLAVNARDAMPAGGTLTIETIGRQPTAMLIVSDTGCGMDEGTLARVFEPFFTTKEPGRGTGLGLAMVYGAITHAGGTINVQSKPFQGTTFQITLPLTTCAEQESANDGVEQSAACSETILLVEDDETVRSLAQCVLERAGYGVLVAANGSEAMAIERTHSGSIDLLLSDVVMPGLSGTELAQRFALARPDGRVLLMSGHGDHPALRQVPPPATAALLHKPFTPDRLASAVRRVLNGQLTPTPMASGFHCNAALIQRATGS